MASAHRMGEGLGHRSTKGAVAAVQAGGLQKLVSMKWASGNLSSGQAEAEKLPRDLLPRDLSFWVHI